MISKSTTPGTKVWHEVYGFGEFISYETEGKFKGFAVVGFDLWNGQTIVHPKKLTEIEDEVI